MSALSLSHVSKTYRLGGSRALRAVDDVSLTAAAGETLGLVGESGCGKSTLARLILHLERPTSGEISLAGRNLNALAPAGLHAARADMQMVFQDPYASLNARMTARRIIGEPLVNYRRASRADLPARVAALAEACGLQPHHLDRYPHELSGGQSQRIGIARAVALDPALIVADEPVSALDVSIQAQIVNLLLRLQAERGLTMIFVSHDLSVVSHIADRVAVMYLGRLVEVAPAARLFVRPMHPYAQALRASVPKPLPAARGRRIEIIGEVPSPLDPPSGCHFRTRCPHARPRCAAERPELRPVGPGQTVACHFAEALAGEPA
jgi:oligopeptide/dipeptide ABC transporter ATP-binding protein